MFDLVGLLGIRLQLLISGMDAPPRPAPYEVADALIGLQVTNNDRERDGFQMEFSLGKDTLHDFGLLRGGVLDVKNRVIIVVIFGTRPQVLIDGIITKHQMMPSNEPGRSTLHVTGEDISVKLSFEDQNLTYPNQSDSDIVKKILKDAGFLPQVTATEDTPGETVRIPTQRCNHLKYIQQLAQRNGFSFYVEPSNIPGLNVAYWGKEKRDGEHQPALTMNMGPQTNVDTPINFSFNALVPAEPDVSILDPVTKVAIPVPVPSSFLPSLTKNPIKPLRKTITRDTANLSFAQALLKAISGASEDFDVIVANGEVDALRYGRVLRARRLVDVAGVGQTYNGTYYVQQVTHSIKRVPHGQYTQSFTLQREGRGAAGISVVPPTS